MGTWSEERKREACFGGPLGADFGWPDTQVIERPGWYQVITPSAPAGVLNEVVVSRVDEADAERVIDETLQTYRAIGQPTKWHVGSWTRPEDFGARLERRGFARTDVRGMGRETATHRSPHAQSRGGTAVVDVGLDDLDAYVAVELAGWGLGGSAADRQQEAYRRVLAASPRTVHLFGARLEGELVGTAALVLRGDSAYLLGAQVLERARGRGLYRALVERRLAFLHQRGIEYAVTHARESTSAPLLERFGFETLFRAQTYVLR